MAEEALLYIFIVMVAVIMANLACAIYHKKEQKIYERHHKQLIDWFFGSRTERWKSMGAYETENGGMYLDLDGIRLVITDGKIEGWYIP